MNTDRKCYAMAALCVFATSVSIWITWRTRQPALGVGPVESRDTLDAFAPNWEVGVARDGEQERGAIFFLDGTNWLKIPTGFNLDRDGSFIVNGRNFTTASNRVVEIKP